MVWWWWWWWYLSGEVGKGNERVIVQGHRPHAGQHQVLGCGGVHVTKTKKRRRGRK
jgi:hypothetical protein